MSNLILMRSEGDDLPVFAGTEWHEAVETWRAIEESMNAHLWHLGAIAAHIESRYGESDVRRFAYEVGRSTRRIYQLARTYRAFRAKRRSEVLSFTHHQIAAESPQPEEMIERAEVESLSTRQLEAVVRGEPYEPLSAGEVHGSAPADISQALSHFYGFIRARPCLRCGATRHVEAAHIRGMVSMKTGDILPRSHQGLPAWSAVPLCADCHREAEDSVHAVGEDAFFERLGKPPGWVYRWLVAALVQFFTRERE